jgi:hypothetical protein
MLKRSIAALVGALCVAGCQTTANQQAQVNASLDQRLTAYNGATMADFMGKTGMMPSDYYPVSEGRVFIFQGSPIYMTLPATAVTPAVTRSSACQLLIRAVRIGPAGGVGADNWKIMGTQRTGPCDGLPV